MKPLIRSLSIATSILTGILLTLAGLEILLRVLPTSGGINAADPNRGWPTHTMVPNMSYTQSIGWNFDDVTRGHINNMGYAAPFDYVPGSSGIVVLGNSFVESLMVPYEDSLQGAL